LLTGVLHSGEPVDLRFPDSASYWRARRLLYGLRKAMTASGFPEAARLHFSCDPAAYGITVSTSRDDPVLSVIARAAESLRVPVGELPPLTSLPRTSDGGIKLLDSAALEAEIEKLRSSK